MPKFIATDQTTSDDRKRAASFIGEQTKDLQAAATQLERLPDLLSGRDLMKLRHLTIENESGGPYLARKFEKVTLREGGAEVTDETKLHAKAVAMAEAEIKTLAADLKNVGMLARKVRLNRETLSEADATVLLYLPDRLAEAAGILDMARKMEMSPPVQTIAPFEQSMVYLDKLATEVGDAGAMMVEHNESREAQQAPRGGMSSRILLTRDSDSAGKLI